MLRGIKILRSFKNCAKLMFGTSVNIIECCAINDTIIASVIDFQT